MSKIKSYKDLIVWQKSVELVVKIYSLTGKFPQDERFGLVIQMRRSAVSVPSNIAEGYSRDQRREYIRFLSIAYGSAAELETQLEISLRLGYIGSEEFAEICKLGSEVMRMLNVIMRKLKDAQDTVAP